MPDATWQETVLRGIIGQPACHDEPMPGWWFCGHCPYAAVGTMCMKCGGPRYDGTPGWER